MTCSSCFSYGPLKQRPRLNACIPKIAVTSLEISEGGFAWMGLCLKGCFNQF